MRMGKKLSYFLAFLIIAGMLAFPIRSFAEDAEESDDASETSIEVEHSESPRRDLIQQNVQMKREENETRSEENEMHREEMQQTIQERKQALQDRLGELSDQRKAALVERINTQLANLNQRLTSAWMHGLEQMSDIAARLGEKADTPEEQAAVTSAQDAIAAAIEAVQAQAEKDYTLTINDETTLREDVMATKDQLKSDLRTVHGLIVEAHNALRAAAESINSGSVTETPTP